MQPTETDNKNLKNPKDEDNINFRPSPNFKHMKKYLKFKFEENSNSSPPNPGLELAATPGVDDQSVVSVLKMAENVQPPLPPNPPPDSPPTLIPKKEKIDDECHTGEESAEGKPDDVAAQYKPDEIKKTSEKIMCRQFVRGTCTRGAACIYVHDLILSQLPGVYTFCKNFQNTICTFSRCKFVHATVFEKEHFYRTGYLPPHTLAHLTQPSPPQQNGHEAPQCQTQPGTMNGPPPPLPPPPPPQIVNTGVPPIPMFTCPPAPYTEDRHINNNSFSGASPENGTSPIKREWTWMEELSNTPHDRDLSEPVTKKCKDCDLNEFRMQCFKNKADKLSRSIEEMKTSSSMYTKKRHKLNTFLMLLFKTANASSDTIETANENETNTLNNGNMNLPTLLAMLLLKRDDALTPDPS